MSDTNRHPADSGCERRELHRLESIGKLRLHVVMAKNEWKDFKRPGKAAFAMQNPVGAPDLRGCAG
jgi:hypothetical protein